MVGVLQEKTFTRIGDTALKTSDFRLVAATHRNLREMITTGLFREDLYYRIAGALISMPYLRERRSDIMLVATVFRTRFANNHGMADKQSLYRTTGHIVNNVKFLAIFDSTSVPPVPRKPE